MFELHLLCPEDRVDVLSEALEALDALSWSCRRGFDRKLASPGPARRRLAKRDTRVSASPTNRPPNAETRSCAEAL